MSFIIGPKYQRPDAVPRNAGDQLQAVQMQLVFDCDSQEQRTVVNDALQTFLKGNQPQLEKMFGHIEQDAFFLREFSTLHGFLRFRPNRVLRLSKNSQNTAGLLRCCIVTNTVNSEFILQIDFRCVRVFGVERIRMRAVPWQQRRY